MDEHEMDEGGAQALERLMGREGPEEAEAVTERGHSIDSDSKTGPLTKPERRALLRQLFGRRAKAGEVPNKRLVSLLGIDCAVPREVARQGRPDRLQGAL